MAVSNQAACVGTRVWAIDNYNVNTPGQEDRLLSPLVDLAGSADSRLLFKHAYRPYSASYPDRLRVEVSADCGLSWSTVFNEAGTVLATGAASTAAWTPTACSNWRQNSISLSAFDGQQVLVRFVNVNQWGNWLYLDDVVIERNGVRVALKLLLDGPYDDNTGLMRDDLRAGGLLPTQEPYTALGFTQVAGGGESVSPAVLGATGSDAIVDWVMLELRDAVVPGTVIATRSALLQRDGDVVDLDGASPVVFRAGNGSYRVVARHRNHLGAMTASPIALSTTAVGVDLTLPGTATFGSEAQRLRNGRTMLWSGDAFRDGELRYVGELNDRDPLLLFIGGSVPTNVSAPGYHQLDISLDGVVRYVGEGNDRDPILVGVGGNVPTNTRAQQLP